MALAWTPDTQKQLQGALSINGNVYISRNTGRSPLRDPI